MHALKTLTLLRLEICCEKVNIWLKVSRRDSISKCQNVKRWFSTVWWSVLKNTHTGTSGCGCVSTYDHCYVWLIVKLFAPLLSSYFLKLLLYCLFDCCVFCMICPQLHGWCCTNLIYWWIRMFPKSTAELCTFTHNV